MTRKHIRERVIILLILLGAFFIRLYKLNATSLWYDETFVLHFAQQGILNAARELFHYDNAIPLHGVLVALWIKLAGNGEFTARLSSVLLSTLTVPLVYHLSRALSGRKYGAWWGAAAFAVMPIYIYYGQEVRMYALATLLSAVFVTAYSRLLRTKTRSAIAGYAAAGVMMMMAHLYAGLLWAALLVAGMLTWLFFPEQRKPIMTRRWLIANGVLAIAGTPIAVWALWRARVDATGVSAIPLDALRGIPLFYGIGQYVEQPWTGMFLVLAGILLLLAVFGLWRDKRRHALIALLCGLLLPVLLLIGVTLVKAKWSERYLLPSMGLALVVGIGVTGAWVNGLVGIKRANNTLSSPPHPNPLPPGERGLRFLLTLMNVMLIVLGLWASLVQAQGTVALVIQDEWHPRPDFRSAARYIAQNTRAGDAIAVVAGYAAHNLEYYYDGGAPVFGVPPETYILDTQRVIDLNTLTQLEESAGEATQLWVVLWQDRLADPLSLVQSTLVDRCNRLPVSDHFTNIGMMRFDITTCRPLDAVVHPPNPLDIAFTEPVALTGYHVIRTDETWEVDLWWQTTGDVAEDYTVFVHLLDADGNVVDQHDHIAGDDGYPSSMWAPGSAIRDRFFLTVPGGECNDCELYLGLYNTNGRLPLAEGGDAVQIALENE